MKDAIARCQAQLSSQSFDERDIEIIKLKMIMLYQHRFCFCCFMGKNSSLLISCYCYDRAK